MKKSTRNVLIGLGATAVGIGTVAAVSYSITKELLKIAMDRETPKSMGKCKGNGKGMGMDKEKLAGSADMANYIRTVSNCAEKLKNCEHEMIGIQSHDGLRLAGHWVPCDKPKRVVIAMHGWRSAWYQDFGVIADFWHDSGCSVLYAEQRGQGESEGKYMGFGMLERYDTLDWVNWVNEKTGSSLPIYLCGVSMGATTVLMTAGLKLPDNVKGIVADCAFTSPQAIWKHVVENNLHMPYSIHAAAASDLCKKRINMSSQGYSTVEAMRHCKIPVLFIHGTDDKFVPVEMTYENYKACASEKELLIVPGAGHGMSYLTDKGKYERELTIFWKKCDGFESARKRI